MQANGEHAYMCVHVCVCVCVGVYVCLSRVRYLNKYSYATTFNVTDWGGGGNLEKN